jgi:hypothetical protein
MINRTAARILFPGTEPIGRTLPAQLVEGQSVEVVGVVPDVRQQGVHREATAQIYLPLLQVSGTPTSFLVLGDGDPKLLIEPLRHAVLELDPAQPISSARPLGVGQAVRVTLTGIVGGTFATLVLSRLTKGLLSNVNAFDTFSHVVAAAVLGGAAFLASYSLARRAARIDPVVNLRMS